MVVLRIDVDVDLCRCGIVVFVLSSRRGLDKGGDLLLPSNFAPTPRSAEMML
jgi:hypothetical protein